VCLKYLQWVVISIRPQDQQERMWSAVALTPLCLWGGLPPCPLRFDPTDGVTMAVRAVRSSVYEPVCRTHSIEVCVGQTLRLNEES